MPNKPSGKKPKQAANITPVTKGLSYTVSTYSVINNESIKIYNPATVSTKKRIISA